MDSSRCVIPCYGSSRAPAQTHTSVPASSLDAGRNPQRHGLPLESQAVWFGWDAAGLQSLTHAALPRGQEREWLCTGQGQELEGELSCSLFRGTQRYANCQPLEILRASGSLGLLSPPSERQEATGPSDAAHSFWSHFPARLPSSLITARKTLCLQSLFSNCSTHQNLPEHRWQTQGPRAESGPIPSFIRPSTLFLPSGSARLSLNC